MNRITLATGLLVLVRALVCALRRLSRLLAIGAAYKATILANTIFGAGRAIDSQRAPEISADSYRILRTFRAEVDASSRSVAVSFFGLRRRTATFPASP